MGCAASKLENEDTVRRCKDRCRLMKDAVYARHHLAAAHSDYCNSLKTTGAALLAFAAGEPLSVSGHTPAVLIHTKPTTTTTPPPPPPTKPPPQMSTTSSEKHHPPPPKPRRKTRIKLPHILSDSSFTSSPPPNHNNNNFTYNARANSTYSTTASQASSVWNWDQFHPPPSPPDSEYFEKLQNNNRNRANDDKDSTFPSNSTLPGWVRNPTVGGNEANRRFDDSSSYSRYSYNPNEQWRKEERNMRRWESEEEGETEREEVECSEWGDRDQFSVMSSSSDEDEKEGSMKNEAADTGNVDTSEKGGDGKSSDGWGNENKDSERKMLVRHKDLEEIVAALKEFFDKAASAGEPVSEMLETGRVQLDRSFRQLRKTVYHSSGMLSNLSSRWTSKPPLEVRYRFDPNSVEESGSSKSLFSTLDKLLAWENKLYQEVKTREGVKIAHEQKLSVLQSQECRAGNESKLDKTKASIKRLQSLISVTSQAVSATSSAIVSLRDSVLVPQLVELCHGFMYMWRSMNQYHETQNNIVQQVRGLVNRTTKGESTSDLHRQATRDLESSLSSWHSNFCRLIKFQRTFIRSLHGWLKLTLQPTYAERSNGNEEPSKTLMFFDEWKLAIDQIPDAVPSEAIKSFINVIHSISLKQTEELKIKKQTETASKGLEKKASSLRNIEKKYYQSYSTVGIGVPDTGPDHVLDARDPLAEKKAELSTYQRRVEDEILKHSRAVEVTKAMTLNNIQTGLPGVFQAMTSFSAMVTEALVTVCARSYAV